MATLVELKARAKKMGYKGYSKLKKGDLEKLLTTPPPKPPRTKPVSQRVPVKQVRPAKKAPAPAPAKKAPAKKAPARPKKQAGYTIKEVKNDNELKDVVKQYIRNWVSRPAQQREYNKIKDDGTFPEVKIKSIFIDAIKGTSDIILRGSNPYDKSDNFDARKMAFDIKFMLNRIGRKAPYKIEPLFDDTSFSIYKGGRRDTEYPIFVEIANAGNKDLDGDSVEKAENTGLRDGISFAREGDEGAFAAKRAESKAYRKQRAKEIANMKRANARRQKKK